jgi:predicted permease
MLTGDLKVAARTLWKSRGFTIVAVLTIALGIGANTAIFTLIHAVMLKSLPVSNPGELYRFGDTNNCCVNGGLQGSYSLYPYPFYKSLQEQTPEFVQLAGFQATVSNLAVRRTGVSRVAEAYTSEFVSGNYFTMFGVRAFAGRVFGVEDDQVGLAPVTVLSYHTWRDRFGLDPTIVGAAVALNGVPATVIGVTGPDFFGDTLRPNPPDFWIPFGAEPALRGTTSLLSSTSQAWVYAIGRLQSTANPQQVQSRVTAILQQWLSDQSNLTAIERSRIPAQHITLTGARNGISIMARAYGDGLKVLAAVSALVLLIACANIANLLLARANPFQLAVRSALGATRQRLIRQTLTEGVLLALSGGTAGIAVAYAGTRAILLLAFSGFHYVPIDATPSVSILGFAFALSLLTGILFSAVPAWILSRTSPIQSLRGGSRFTTDRSAVSRKALVVLQAALSLVLLVAAGLLTESLWHLEHQSFGFATEDRLVVKVNPSLSGYTMERLDGLYRQLHQKLGDVQGVVSTGFSLYSPMSGDNWSSDLSIEGRTSDPARPDTVSWDRISSGYFETVGTPILRGRAIDDRDTPNAPHVAVVNEAFALKFFQNEDPIGKHFGMGDATHARDFEIVGIAADAKYVFAEEAAWPTFFLPLLQNVTDESAPANSAPARSNYIHDIVIHLRSGNANVEGAIRQAIAGVDPSLTVLSVITMDEQLAGNFNQQRLIARLTALYGILALTLASVGLYGVAAYSVARRTSEIGIRMALGANRSRVVLMVLRSSLAQVLLGLAIGIPIALAAGRGLATQLYGVSGQDLSILTAASLVLIIAAVMAALVPARRAASIDPMKALRSE